MGGLLALGLSRRFGPRGSVRADGIFRRYQDFYATRRDTSTGKVRYAWNPGKGVTATPALAGRRLYVLSNLGTLFALRLRGG